ncbi:S8 family peptidase [bacterium]|nr:S8 family peptidase [bacterium]
MHSALTPIISGDFLVAGVDQLWTDTEVNYFSEYGRYQSMLRQVNTVAQSAAIKTGAASDQIIDTGVDNTHAEFSNRIVRGYCYSTSVGNYLNGTPLPSLCPASLPSQRTAGAGKPCVSPNSDLNDALTISCRHGTHVAGIAASANAVPAISGLAPNAKLISIYDESGRQKP